MPEAYETEERVNELRQSVEPEMEKVFRKKRKTEYEY